MQIEREVQKWGNKSLVIVIPPDLAKFLELEVGNEIVLQDEEGTKGKYCSFWKKKKGR